MTQISREILEKAGQGDIPAFEAIYRQYCGFVYNVAYRVTGNHADAQEVTQDVFMKLYRNLKNFFFRSSFATWLYRITVNTAISLCRARRHRNAQISLDEQLIQPGTENNIREKLDAGQQVQALLEKLNPQQRACLALREMQGASYREIAATLMIPLNTVRSRLKRARLALLAGAPQKGSAL